MPTPSFAPEVRALILLLLLVDVDAGLESLVAVVVASIVNASEVAVAVVAAPAAPVVMGPPDRSTSASAHWLLFEPALLVELARRLNQQDVAVVKRKLINMDPS